MMVFLYLYLIPKNMFSIIGTPSSDHVPNNLYTPCRLVDLKPAHNSKLVSEACQICPPNVEEEIVL